VRLQHEGGRRVFAKIGHLSREEQLAYWAERTQALIEKQERLRAEAAREAERAPIGTR
jgi:hypothetical protein